MQLILASSSAYRKNLLERLRLPFSCQSPDIDESAMPNEPAEQLVRRLALQKARKIAASQHNALIIGSDQAAVIDHQILGKPHTPENALRQLQRARGKSIHLLTGLCLLNSRTGHYQLDMVPFSVTLRDLPDSALARYVERDSPLDCAGSFKWESLGIALFSAMSGEDVTSLEGLPLIRLVDMLAVEGVSIL